MASPYATKKVSLISSNRPKCCPTEGKNSLLDCKPSSIHRSPQCHVAYTSQCPACDSKPQCGRRRSKSEGLEAADPLREYNRVDRYESSRPRQVHVGSARDIITCNSNSYDIQNQTASSLSSYCKRHISAFATVSDIHRNMERPSTKKFSVSPVKNHPERLLHSNHLHQQKQDSDTINVAQILTSEVNENPRHNNHNSIRYENAADIDRTKRHIHPHEVRKASSLVSSKILEKMNCLKNDRVIRDFDIHAEQLKNHCLNNHSSIPRNSQEQLNHNGSEYDNRFVDHADKTAKQSHLVDAPSLHDRYYREVTMLRNKLSEIRGAEGKRIRQRSESEPGMGLSVTTQQSYTKDPKRARDVSPTVNEFSKYHYQEMSSNGCGGSNRTVNSHRPSGQRAKLPAVPVSKYSPSIKAFAGSSVDEQGTDDQTSHFSSSDSEDCCREQEEFEERGEQEEDSEEDNQSAKSGLTTASSSGSNASSRVRASMRSITLEETAPSSAAAHYAAAASNVPPCLRPSIFSNVPPFIRFTLHDAPKEDTLPTDIHRLLKWKLSSITPLVVRRTLVNSGFRLVRKSNDWCGTWGKHMKSLCFKSLKDFQKINHFPGTFQIGRKDRLWKNLHHLMLKFGKKEFGFIPRTYILPQDSKLLRQVWEKGSGKEKWIIKPPASARGAGIKVVHRWSQIPKKRPLVVQRYVSRPYLINGSKFDLRLYVLVTSVDPLRVYVYDDGLVRFASVRYSEDTASLGDRYMHLTNYSINKLSSQYLANEDSTACRGHKWTLKTLWAYLRKDGVDTTALWASMVDLCIKTVISGESAIGQMTRANLNSRYASYELFGIDVLLDAELRPWLLEVNISPSLHSASPLDLAVKGPMVRDLLNMAGYQVPNKLSRAQQEGYLQGFNLRNATAHLCFDKRLYTMVLSRAERSKHVMHQQTSSRAEYLTEILSELTPDDVRHLLQAEDELTQLGGFARVFPTADTHAYLEYFEAPRYYNMLFDAWEAKYHADRRPGINLLEAKCQKKYHLTIPIPGGIAKSSGSQSNQSLDNSAGWEDEQETKPTPDRKVLSLASMTLYRAARPRSSKFGIASTRPYARSAYLTRRQKSSTLPTALAKCSSLDFSAAPDAPAASPAPAAAPDAGQPDIDTNTSGR